MSEALASIETDPLILHFRPFLKRMSDQEFFEFCQLNPDLRIELTSEGDLVIMPPTGGTTGERNFNLILLFGIWAEADGTGVSFDSSTGFRLSNGARPSPDLAWIRKFRWDALTNDEKDGLIPICPDFVIELRSRTDSIKRLQSKMQEYIENGVQLGWLIDPFEKKVCIYRHDATVECLNEPESVSGDPLLPGFTLHLAKLWKK